MLEMEGVATRVRVQRVAAAALIVNSYLGVHLQAQKMHLMELLGRLVAGRWFWLLQEILLSMV
jgi:hypothetical protein